MRCKIWTFLPKVCFSNIFSAFLWANRHFKNRKNFALAIFGIFLHLGNPLLAKEPTNWLFGVGFGGGLSKLDKKYSDSANTLLGTNGFKPNASRLYSSTVKDWGFLWELLVGYKHFLNDWVGFRYYANVSGQHYKDDIFTQGKTKVGVVEYNANADLLINFYNSESFTLGIFGGFGVGGAYFDTPAFASYQNQWSNETRGRYSDVIKVYKHHLSATLSTGVRFNIFQKIRQVGNRVCSQGSDGRRTCRVPISFLEHSIELNTKFSLMTYRATDSADVFATYCPQGSTATPGPVDVSGKFVCMNRKPGYEVNNPYKFTLRYIIAF